MLLDAGVTIALATDCNPGTSYTTSMPFVVAVACSRAAACRPRRRSGRRRRRGGRAATATTLGRLTAGSAGDLVVLAGEHYVDLAYHPGMDRVAAVVVDGEIVKPGGGSGSRD